MQNTKLAFEQRGVVLSQRLQGKYAAVDIYQNQCPYLFPNRTNSSIYLPKPMLYV
ncbi:MAG: Uncharacterised protein [Cryomorphaceae bacterium]|nr:MAG: Uncharacterised protein [Cryomorphaceae bacterium]